MLETAQCDKGVGKHGMKQITHGQVQDVQVKLGHLLLSSGHCHQNQCVQDYGQHCWKVNTCCYPWLCWESLLIIDRFLQWKGIIRFWDTLAQGSCVRYLGLVYWPGQWYLMSLATRLNMWLYITSITKTTIWVWARLLFGGNMTSAHSIKMLIVEIQEEYKRTMIYNQYQCFYPGNKHLTVVADRYSRISFLNI